ncbi:MAG: hypothetical protein M3Y26_11850 [Actinomycetota bacterium]|nr:hypothetical protein [Actinomycetota bacterium]
MTASRRFRDEIRSYVPAWLSDRHAAKPELSAGFRFLWAMAAPLDAAIDVLMQGLRAAQPGQGTPTALALIGRSRGIIRGQGETDASYSGRLTGWLDRWRIAGTAEAIARSIQEYCANHPRVRIVTRSGVWVTLETNGTITRTTAAWNWDGTSNSERAGYWSELWVIVYPTPWSTTQKWGDGRKWGGRDGALGHFVARQDVDALRGLIAQWKSAHTKIRAVIWTSDSALFDPAVPASNPDGTWGEWGIQGNGPRVASTRNITTCRYWEM